MKFRLEDYSDEIKGRFADLMSEHPALYDKAHPDYMESRICALIWTKMSEELELEGERKNNTCINCKIYCVKPLSTWCKMFHMNDKCSFLSQRQFSSVCGDQWETTFQESSVLTQWQASQEMGWMMKTKMMIQRSHVGLSTRRCFSSSHSWQSTSKYSSKYICKLWRHNSNTQK